LPDLVDRVAVTSWRICLWTQRGNRYAAREIHNCASYREDTATRLEPGSVPLESFNHGNTP